MTLASQIENLLFAAGRALSKKRLARALSVTPEQIDNALIDLSRSLNNRDGGLVLVASGDDVTLGTNPAASQNVADFLKEEQRQELTRPSIETLTIIAYRGPVTKPEIELIRGVNCSLILRNLLIRGLIHEEPQKRTGETLYSVTPEFLEWLGLTLAEQLPDYEKLSSHELFEKILQNHDGNTATS